MSTVGLEITNSCPWSCDTCLPASGRARVGELDASLLRYLLELLAELGYDGICFSGGEPLLHPEIRALLSLSTALGLRSSLFTSGSGLDGPVLSAISDARAEVVVSLDGADAPTNDETRGAGSFDTAVRALDLLRGSGARASVTCTVTRRNLHRLDDLVDVAIAAGASRVSFNEVVRGGRAVKNWASLGLSVEDRSTLRDWFVSRAPSWPGATDAATDSSCWVDGRSLYINAQGRCYACSETAQFGLRNRYGQITGDRPVDVAMIDRIRSIDLRSSACRYDMVASGQYLLVLDSLRPCVGLDVHAGEAVAAEVLFPIRTGREVC